MPTSPIDRLRLLLRANAAFSVVGGIVALIAAPWLSRQLGIDNVLITALLGAGLLIFAVDVFFVTRRSEAELLAQAVLVSAADLVWVAGTVVVLAADILTTRGSVVAALVGLVVADFGVTQLWLRSRSLGRERAATLAG